MLINIQQRANNVRTRGRDAEGDAGTRALADETDEEATIMIREEDLGCIYI